MVLESIAFGVLIALPVALHLLTIRRFRRLTHSVERQQRLLEKLVGPLSSSPEAMASQHPNAPAPAPAAGVPGERTPRSSARVAETSPRANQRLPELSPRANQRLTDMSPRSTAALRDQS